MIHFFCTDKMTIVISWEARSAYTSFRAVSRPPAGDVLTTETGGLQTRESIQGEHYPYAAYHLFENHRRGIMFKGSRTQVNRASENREKTSEFGFGPELGFHPDDLRVKLPGYCSRLLRPVKEQSEVID